MTDSRFQAKRELHQDQAGFRDVPEDDGFTLKTPPAAAPGVVMVQIKFKGSFHSARGGIPKKGKRCEFDSSLFEDVFSLLK